jgi:hypothetical protein
MIAFNWRTSDFRAYKGDATGKTAATCASLRPNTFSNTLTATPSKNISAISAENMIGACATNAHSVEKEL